jgi:hypothetical protein
MPPTKQPKSAMMGIIGLVVVVVAAVIFFVLSVRLYTQLLEMLGPELAAGQVPSAGALSQQQIEQLSGPGAGMLGITVVGIVGLVLSIIATAQNKGRVFGIIGIVVGVIAPFSLFFAAGFAAAGM